MEPSQPAPPMAAARPKVLEAHGDRREDPYYWLREKDNPEVIAYLEAENSYTEAVTAPTAALRERLYREIVGRVQETDTSAPSYFRGYWSYTRTVEGLDYEIYCRRAESMKSPEQVTLDGNELAKGHDYFELGFVESTPDQNVVAYAADYTGAELFELRFRDLDTGRDLTDVLHDVYYGFAWASDNQTFFYVKADAAMRPFQVWRHELGAPAENDALVLQEDDERFELSVEPTKSERYIVFSSSSQLTAECRFIPADEPLVEPVLIEPRRHGIEYSVDHQEDRFLILTNDGALDFRLMAAPVSSPGRASWAEVVPERDGVRLNFTDVHQSYVVLGERAEGLQRLEVLDSATGAIQVVEQPDAAYTAFPGSNPVYESEVMRFFYPDAWGPRWHAALLALSRDVGEHSVRQMRSGLAFVRSTDPYDHGAIKAFTLELAREVACADLAFIRRIKAMRREMETRVRACGGALMPKPPRHSAPPWAAETARLGSSTGLELSTELLPPPVRS